MGAGARACLGRGNRGPRKGIGIRVHPPAPVRGSSGRPLRIRNLDSRREVWGRGWGPPEPARPRGPGARELHSEQRSGDGEIRIPGFLFEWYLNLGTGTISHYGEEGQIQIWNLSCVDWRLRASCVTLGNLLYFPESHSSSVHLLSTIPYAEHCAGCWMCRVDHDKILAFLECLGWPTLNFPICKYGYHRIL